MKTKTLLLLSLLFLLADPGAFAQEKSLDSKITQVVVYPDRALVTRQAAIRLEKGTHELRLEALPGSIEEDSISAKGEGETKVKLFGVRLDRMPLRGAQLPRAREIEIQIEKLNDLNLEIQNQKQILQEKRNFLTSIKAASADQIGKDIVTKQPSTSDASSMLDFMGKELAGIYAAEQAAERQMRDNSKEIDKLQRELYETGGGMDKQRAALVIDLEAETAGDFVLEVSYRLAGASWHPVYEARTSSDAKDVQVVFYGMIRQGTGEDWEDVSLRLSTARPSIGGRMPEPESWFLKKYEPPVLYQRQKDLNVMRATLAADASAEAYGGAAPAAPAMAEMAVAAVEDSGPAVEFVLPKKESVRADWEPKKVSVSSFKMPAVFEYQAVPKLSPYAYWSAKVKNNSSSQLLAGPIQVFVNGAFSGTSSIDLVGMNETFDLSLGIEERVRIERRLVKEKSDTSVLSGFHGKTKTVDYEYLTILENLKTSEVKLTVWDSFPVSQNDEIKVEQPVFDPKPTEEDSEKPGVKGWKFSLKPNVKQSLKISYRLKYPADFRIEGL